MKIIVLFLLSLYSLLFAKTRCYDFDDYMSYSNDLVEIKKFIEKNAEQREFNNCISEGGEGSVFRMASSSIHYDECGDESNPDGDYKSGSTNGYLENNFCM